MSKSPYHSLKTLKFRSQRVDFCRVRCRVRSEVFFIARLGIEESARRRVLLLLLTQPLEPFTLLIDLGRNGC